MTTSAVPQPSLSDYVGAFKRRRRLFGLVGLPIAVAGLVSAIALPSVYKSTATFQLAQDQSPDASRYVKSDYADKFVSTLTGRVLGTDSLGAVLKSVNPYPNVRDEQAALDKFRGDVRVDMVTERILDPGSGLQRNVNTGFTVDYFNRDPEKAREAATWLASAFVSAGRAARATEAQESSEFLGKQADRTRAQIAEQEARLADFKKQNLGQLPESTLANMASMERARIDIGSIDQQLLALRQNRIFLQQNLTQVQSGGGDAATLAALQEEYRRKAATYSENHPDVIALRRQIERLKMGNAPAEKSSLQAQLDAEQATLAEAQRRYSDDHPDIRRLKRDIESLKARIAAGDQNSAGVSDLRPEYLQAQSQVRSIDTQISSLERQSSDLRARLRDFESKMQSAPDVERKYQDLMRDLTAARKQYDELVDQRMQADIRAAAALSGRGDEFRLVGTPSLPGDPAKPARLLIVLVSLAFALAAATMAVLAAEVLDPTLRGSGDLQRILELVPLAVIPEIATAEDRERKFRFRSAVAACLLGGASILFLLVRFASK